METSTALISHPYALLAVMMLVPVAILLALFGYAIGNYLGWFAAVLCRLVL